MCTMCVGANVPVQARGARAASLCNRGFGPISPHSDTSSRCSLCDPFKKRLVHSRLPACAGGLEVLKDLCAIPDTDQLLCWCCLRTALTPFAFLCEGGPHSGVPTLLYNYRIGHLGFFCSGKRPIFAGCGGNDSFPLRGTSRKLFSRSA